MKILLVAISLISLVSTEWHVDLHRNLARFYNKIKPYVLNVEDRESRVVGGEIASPAQFPYQCAITTDTGTRTVTCGASVIGIKAVLTTASCIANGFVTEVIAGAFNRSQIEPTQQRQVVTYRNYRVHPEYDPNVMQNDIAVILMDRDFDLSGRYVKAIPLSSSTNQFVGEIATLSGFGRYFEPGGPVSDLIRFVYNPIIANSECRNWFGIITSSHICVSGENGRSACVGDAGGPLTLNGEQIGIMSFGSPFGCDIWFPSGYTRVTSFYDWIHLQIA